MRAILIDPHSETISEVVYDGDWRTISKWIDAERFDLVHLDETESIYVDDEGLFQDNPKFFFMYGWPQPLAGKGLVLGSNDEGDSVSSTLSIEELRKKIKFIDRNTVALLVQSGAFGRN